MRKLKFALMFLVIFLFYISSVNAETKLICLKKGETIKFSLCNDYMEDRTCNSEWTCNYCVNEIRIGVYCPTQINYCNQLGLACQSLKEPNNPPSNQSNSTGNNSTSENNQNPAHKEKKSTISVTPSAINENLSNSENSSITITSSNDFKIENKKNNFIFLKLFLSLFLLEFFALSFLLYTAKKKKII